MSDLRKTKPRLVKDYALYKGDEFLAVGSVEELAEYLNVKRETVQFMSYPSYRKRFIDDSNRLVVIKLEYDQS